MKYFAIPLDNISATLVSVDINNDNYDSCPRLTKEEYDYLLDRNVNHGADLRFVEKDGQIEVKDFYNHSPSQFHHWDSKAGKFALTKENKEKWIESQKEEKRSALIQEKQSLFDELRLCDYLDEKDKAKEIALKIKELDSKIEAL